MCNQVNENQIPKIEGNNIEEKMLIEEPIQCDCGFSTKDGKEMYEHLWGNPHIWFFSTMQYAMSWAVGDLNTYDWLIRGVKELDVKYLRKCECCKKPYIAYDRKDKCKKCQIGVS